jgi:hypothetical protein
MVTAQDALHVFDGLRLANSAYYNEEIVKEMIKKDGKGNKQGMQGFVHDMQGMRGMQGGNGDDIRDRKSGGEGGEQEGG